MLGVESGRGELSAQSCHATTAIAQNTSPIMKFLFPDEDFIFVKTSLVKRINNPAYRGCVGNRGAIAYRQRENFRGQFFSDGEGRMGE